MKAIKIAFALCIASVSVFTAGCGKSKLLLAAEEYQTAACACKDLACVNEASKKYGEKTKEAGAGSASEAEALTKATTAAAECVTKVTMANIPKVPGMPAVPGAH
jgi:hypothetical protein